RIASELPLPELRAAIGAEPAEVFVRLGAVPAPLGLEPGIHAAAGGTLLVIEDVGRYWVADGASVIVEPLLEAPDRNVRLFLLGSVLGLVLHQRGLLPLHANAVEIGGRAFLFMGPSGEGKSTLAAWFHDRGLRVIADDVCVAERQRDGRLLAFPGIPRLRLWKDALEATGRCSRSYERSYRGDDSYEKFDVPIAARGDEPVEIAALCELAQGDRTAIRRLEGLAAAEAVF